MDHLCAKKVFWNSTVLITLCKQNSSQSCCSTGWKVTLLIRNCVSSADLITNLRFIWFKRPRCHCINEVRCVFVFRKPWDLSQQLEPQLTAQWKRVSKSSNQVPCIFDHILLRSHKHYELSKVSKSDARLFLFLIMNSRNKYLLDQFTSLETNLQIISFSICPSAL